MTYYIRRGDTENGPWLKRTMPFVAWGPRDQAKKFASRREALAACRIAARGVLDKVSVITEDTEDSAAGD